QVDGGAAPPGATAARAVVAIRAAHRHPADAPALAAVPARRAGRGAGPGVDAWPVAAGGAGRDGGRRDALGRLPARLLEGRGREGARPARADRQGAAHAPPLLRALRLEAAGRTLAERLALALAVGLDGRFVRRRHVVRCVYGNE